MEISMDQFEEVNQKWKDSNDWTSESWWKVEAMAMGYRGLDTYSLNPWYRALDT